MTPIRPLAISLLLSLCASVTAADELRIFYAEAPGIVAADIRPAAGLQKTSQPSTLSFQAFGRHFELELQSNERLLSPLARAKQTELSRYSLYRGQLTGLSGSWVRLLKDGDELRGAIWDGYELYTIESARNVTPFLIMSLSVSGSTPVIYRLSDTDSGIGADFCSVAATDEAPSAALQKFQALTTELEANQALSGVTRRIEVAAIADHDFFHDNGGDSESALLARMNIVDGIFSEAVGLTIAVTEVRILTDS